MASEACAVRLAAPPWTPALVGPTHLLDVLEMLPLGIVDASLWSQLPAPARASLHGACPQSRRLVEQLLTSAHLDLTTPAAARPDATQLDFRQQLALVQMFEQRGAFLARLPHLHTVKLSNWSDQADLVTALAQCGSATRDAAVTTLRLRGTRLALAGVQALALLHLPRLCELELGGVVLERPSGGRPLVCMSLKGHVLLPLRGVTSLTKLSVRHGYVTGPDFMRSLGSLSHLSHLHLLLYDSSTAHHDLRLLTGLISLRHCDVDLTGSDGVDHTSTLLDVAPLFAATQLTVLWLRLVEADLGGPGPLDGATAVAMAHLGALSLLQSLDLGPYFLVGDSAFGAIKRLTRLTELSVAVMSLSLPSPGHLPLLQRLHIGKSTRNSDFLLPPGHLLASLQPLLPLPSLTGLNAQPLQLFISHDGGADGPVQAAGLRLLLPILAAAPRLQLSSTLVLQAAGLAEERLTLTQIGAALRALAGRVSDLVLMDTTLDGESWGALHAHWVPLRHLELRHCTLTVGDVLSILHHMTALRRLTLRDCSRLMRSEWLQVASRQWWPLRIEVAPPLPEDLVCRCQAEQQRAFGMQLIDWAQGDT